MEARQQLLTNDSATKAVRSLALVATILAVVGSSTVIAIGQAGAWLSNYGAFGAMMAVFLGVLVWLVVPGQPRNAVVWVFASTSLLLGIWVAGYGIAAVQMRDLPNVSELVFASRELVPASIPSEAAWVLLFTGPASTAGLFIAITFGLLLFPDGKLPAPRWRWIGWLAAVGVALSLGASVWSYRPQHSGPVEDGVVIGVGVAIVLVCALAGAYGLFVRFRRGNERTKRQLKWILFGTMAFVPALIAGSIASGSRYEDLVVVPFMVAAGVFLGAIAIAVARHDLFDIDVVISRTFVVGGLAAFVTVVYALLVGVIGILLGAGTDAALPLSVAATVIVAIAFQPLRQRMQRWANRLVYGERATPYEVLSQFSGRMRDTAVTQDVIPRMARLLTEGTGAAEATVWVQTDDQLLPVASWPVVGDEKPRLDSADHTARVEHDGESLGALTVRMPRGEALTTGERRLIDDLASQAGLVLRNERLIQALRSSRQRIVAAQDEERRRLERDLHDGAQQQLVALKLKLALAQRIDDEEKRNQLLGTLMSDADDAVESLRDLARGIYPPVLAQDGLVSALQAQAGKAALPVKITADQVRRYRQEVEAAVYFCTLEAIQNVAKYAEATRATVVLAGGNGTLRFEIRDDGRGFEPSTTERGLGLRNMEDRIEALGGSISVASAPGTGTTISGSVPAKVLTPSTNTEASLEKPRRSPD